MTSRSVTRIKVIKPFSDRDSDASSDEDLELEDDQEDLKELWSTFVKAREKWKVKKEKMKDNGKLKLTKTKLVVGQIETKYCCLLI